MLAPKTQNTPFIGVFKLGTGEEIIAKVTEETMLAYTIERPLCVVPAPNNSLQFAPFLIMGDASKPIQLPKPVIRAIPFPEFEQQYESITTGVALPKKQGIITA